MNNYKKVVVLPGFIILVFMLRNFFVGNEVIGDINSLEDIVSVVLGINLVLLSLSSLIELANKNLEKHKASDRLFGFLVFLIGVIIFVNYDGSFMWYLLVPIALFMVIRAIPMILKGKGLVPKDKGIFS
jgi:hypothetical protein